MQKFSSVHQFILEIQLILEPHGKSDRSIFVNTYPENFQ